MLVRQPDRLGIYVHYPYCLQKCHYCDFYSLPMEGSIGDDWFAKGIEAELESRVGDFQHFSTVDSIFFGGGTSSLLSPEVIDQLIDLFRSRFVLSDDCEITLEGNPENLTAEYLAALHSAGVTRINAGIQTFSEKYLTSMNRYFDRTKYENILDVLSRSHFRSRGVDLIYGFPGQTVEEFLADLGRVVNTGLEHLSIYSLTVESGTAFANMIRTGERQNPDAALQEQIYEILPSHLYRYGYTLYEISNFAKPGFECRHNLRYWLYEPYIGLGPGAHGFNGRLRYGNARNIERWNGNPAGAERTIHKPELDVPLNLFRLTVPFRLSWMHSILEESGSGRAADVKSFFDRQASLVRGRFVAEDLFEWTDSGRLMLDSIIEEWVNG